MRRLLGVKLAQEVSEGGTMCDIQARCMCVTSRTVLRVQVQRTEGLLQYQSLGTRQEGSSDASSTRLTV